MMPVLVLCVLAMPMLVAMVIMMMLLLIVMMVVVVIVLVLVAPMAEVIARLHLVVGASQFLQKNIQYPKDSVEKIGHCSCRFEDEDNGSGRQVNNFVLL